MCNLFQYAKQMKIKQFFTKRWLVLTLSIASIVCCPAFAEGLNPFVQGSYQTILNAHRPQPFMLVIWSVDCPSCLKDMELISKLHKDHPELKIVMLSTDEPDLSAEINKILDQHGLSGLENWVFAADDSQRLRYEIDPSWYGEMPRTYFFNRNHQRTGLSGALSLAEFEKQIAAIR